ncbi:MAG: MurR/RpiR family transcriptional regulator [Oscillospiraceae bacterium]|nr:MurR/RpiR family transcriptional regulator [Oscillospiraceae bacterium]
MERDILLVIKDGLPDFSKGQKRIAHYVLEHYDEAAYMNAAMLGSVVNVSESTVVRFAMQLGYKGYPEFLRDLSSLVKSKLTSIQRVGVAKMLIGEEDIVERVLTSDADCVKKSIRIVDRADFNAAVRAVVNAECIYIIGIRSAFSLAVFLNCYLSMMFKNVKLISSTSASEMFEQIRAIGKSDIMIGISFPRYSQRTVKALDYARRQGAAVLSITDSETSPLLAYSNYKLLAKCEIMSFVDSLVSPLSVINALLLAIGMAKQEELREALAELEEIWDEYDVYDKGAEDDRSS